MTRLWLLVLLLVCPAISAAQSVVVRSGEHDGFTRLVFDLPAAANWVLKPEASGVLLDLGNPALSFDVSEAFRRIGRDRISELKPGPRAGTLEIAFACACTAEAFVLGSTMLVVDVKPGAPSESTGGTATGNSALADLTQVQIGGMPRLGPRRDRIQELPILPSLPIAEEQATNSTDVTARDMAEMLARGATQGLLDFRPSKPLPLPDKSDGTSAVKPLPDATPGEDRARAFSVTLREQDGQEFVSIGADPCVPDRSLDLAGWAGADDTASDLAKLRAALYGEFDRIDDGAVTSYAKALLHYGFGAEARQVLALLAKPADPVLQSLTWLVDGERDPVQKFTGQLDCSGRAAFWALLSVSEKSQDGSVRAPVNPSAFLATFEELPQPLRRHLGPRAADRLVALGETDLAEDLLRRLERSEGNTTAEIALTRAKLDLRNGNTGSARTNLENARGSEAALQPARVIAEIDVALADETSVPDGLVDLSAAFAEELQGTEDGTSAWAAHVRALIANSDFDTAFDMIRTDREGAENENAALFDRATSALVRSPDVAAFLKHGMRLVSSDPQRLRPETAIAMAARFLDLGFADSTLDLLDKSGLPSETSEVKRLRARALIMLARPEEAEVALIGIRDAQAAALRAEARRMMGDHTYARTIYAELDRTEDAGRAAWLAGDFDDAAQSAETRIAEFARWLDQSRENTADGPTETLSEMTALPEQSAETRSRLRDLLAATELE